MHIQRFWSYFLFCLLIYWTILGCYPFGEPISDGQDLSRAPGFKLVQYYSIFAMMFVSFVAISTIGFVFVEFLKLKNVEEFRKLHARRAAVVSRIAPFAVCALIATMIRLVMDFQQKLFPTFVIVMIFVCCAIMLVVTIATVKLLVYDDPDPEI